VDQLDFPDIDPSLRIPDKTHFKIGEVAKLLDLEPYVLRYWEKEFDLLEPDKTDSGQRAYQRDDIELLATIQQLLYTEMFTIDGARRQLELAQQGEPSYLTNTLSDGDPDGEAAEAVDELREENRRLREQHEQLSAENDRLAAENEELAGDKQTLRNQLSDARQTIEKLKAEQQRLEEAGPGLDAEGREALDELAGQVDALADLTR